MTLEELRQLIQVELDRDEGMGGGDDAEDRGWESALRWVMARIDSPPLCPRCGQPCHKVPTPSHPGDDAWVWGHDCPPGPSEFDGTSEEA